MLFDPEFGHATRMDGQLGAFCFVPGPDGSVAYGVLVEAAQESRRFDFLSLTSFQVWPTSANTFDAFITLPNAFVTVSDPTYKHIQTCKDGRLPSVGSILFRPQGLAIIGLAGKEHERFQVVFDIRTGKVVNSSLHRVIFSSQWQVCCPLKSGGRHVIFQGEAS